MDALLEADSVRNCSTCPSQLVQGSQQGLSFMLRAQLGVKAVLDDGLQQYNRCEPTDSTIRGPQTQAQIATAKFVESLSEASQPWSPS